MPNIERAGIIQKVLARIDHVQTRIDGQQLESDQCYEDKHITTEVHRRGGEKINVRRPDSTLRVGGVRDIIHEHHLGENNTPEQLVIRFRLGDPPSGYTIVSDDELEEFNKKVDSLPSFASGLWRF